MLEAHRLDVGARVARPPRPTGRTRRPTSARPAPPRSDRSRPSSEAGDRHRLSSRAHPPCTPARRRRTVSGAGRSRRRRRLGAADDCAIDAVRACGRPAGTADAVVITTCPGQRARAARWPGRRRARTARRRARAPASTRCDRRRGGGRPAATPAPACAARPARRGCAPAARRSSAPSSSRCGPTVETPRLTSSSARRGERRGQPAVAPRRVVRAAPTVRRRPASCA